jgi:uncharacterized tellurite resistance protein B-like protein
MYSREQKISHLRALYHLALSDGILSKAETVYIKIVAEGLSIPVEVLEQFDGEEPELILPDHEYKLFSLFHRLALVIMVDGTVHEEEERMCFDLGIKMGLHPNAIGDIISHVKSESSHASPAEIIAIFKRYLN